jgi:maltose O-acetyltransferase
MIHRIQDYLQKEIKVFHPRLMLALFLMALLPRYMGGGLRSSFLRMAGFKIGSKTRIWGTPTIVGVNDIYKNLEIGHNCMIGINTYFDLASSITIKDHTTLGPEIMFITGTHEIGGSEKRAGTLNPKPITIGKGVWIGARATILPGVNIGEGAVIAAGAVVTKDIPSNTMVAGSPAMVKRNFDSQTNSDHF